MPQDPPDWLHKASGESRHKIRLHGPWHYEPLSKLDAGNKPGEMPLAGSMKIPADWSAELGPGFQGSVLFKRRFTIPSNLEASERVALVIEKINGTAAIRINKQDIGTISLDARSSHFDVTDMLEQRNELEINIDWRTDVDSRESGGIVGEVRLEIYEVKP